MGRGGKVVYRRGGGGGGLGGWRTGRGSRARRGSGSDDASDEEYVVGQDEEGEGDTSYDSYSSDASREASRDAEDGTCSDEEEEDDEEEDYDLEDEEDASAGRRRRPRKRPVCSSRKPAAKHPRRRQPAVTDEGEEMGIPPARKPASRQRRRPKISVEEEEDEYEDDEDEDEDFAPEEDEDDEEELARAHGRRGSGGKNRPVKRQRRKGRSRNTAMRERREKAMVSKRRRRLDPISDDDDFVVKDRVSVDGTERKKRISGGRQRRSLASFSDPSESDSSDLDYTISEEELADLLIGGPLSYRGRIPPSGGVQGEKGKGKEISDLGKQVCGICLTEEHNRVIRGLLDCCAHYFCFPCIMEWSKVESRCPVCKRRFKTVSRSARSDAGIGLRTAIIRIPKRDQVYQPSEEEIRSYLDPYANVVCMECQQGGDDNLMLLCDICDSSAHTYCVGLGREVPEGNWYCDVCRSTDPGSLNSRVQEFAVEHGVSNRDILQEESSGGVGTGNIAKCTSLGIPQHSSSLTCQTHSEGIGQGTSIRCQSSVGDSGTASHGSGFAASTVSGRRSIHQRIRIILSNNRVRWIPGVARNDASQHSSLESHHCSSQIDQNGETCHVPQVRLINGMNERSNRSFSRPRVSMHPCHNERSSCPIMGGAKKQVKSIVKNLLSHFTRDTSLGRRDFKEIARHATHTILAACGFQHRRSMVTTAVQAPSNCVHRADGELASLVKDCCSSCFTTFVGNVVQEILNLKFPFA